MENQEHTLYMAYIFFVNFITFVLYGLDKLYAKKHWRRTPEKILLGFAFIGGSIGAMMAMRFFRHKTCHLKFKYGVPLIFILQIAALVYLHLLIK